MDSLEKIADKYLIKTYAQWPITIVKGKGSWVWDSDDKKYLDFYGGHAVALLGHSPATVVKAINEQAEKLLFYSNIVQIEPAIELAEKLAQTLQPERYQLYFCNHGAEANETALKIARKLTGRKQIVAFENSFHGRSMTALAATGIRSYHTFTPDFLDYTTFVKWGDMEGLKEAVNNNTAAVLAEPIQSIGGVNTADGEFFRSLENLCNRHKTCLIFDEVQTGVGRTGTWWYAEACHVKPDIITTAKGLAGGLPIGAVLVKEEQAKEIKTGDLATTFGGNPVVSAAAVAVMETIIENNLLEHVQRESLRFQERLREIPGVEEVRGAGFLLGIETNAPAGEVTGKLRSRGVLAGTSLKPNTMRIFPPLNASREEIDYFTETLAGVL